MTQLRELAKTAAEHADELAMKEDLPFLRGRTRESTLGELRDGLPRGWCQTRVVPVYIDEATALTRRAGDRRPPGRTRRATRRASWS